MKEREGAAPARTRAAPGAAAPADTLVVREEPLLIALGDDHLLTMRTPGDDEDLALGLLLSEGVIEGAADVRSISLAPRGSGLERVDVVRVELAESALSLGRGKLARVHEVRPSCGVCGAASAEGLASGLRPLAPGRPRVAIPSLLRMLEELRARQPIFRATGGAHAAGLFSALTGALLAAGEDVGRHNAVDKAIGRAARAGAPFQDAVLLLSGRAGFELVLKAFRVGVPVVASVSAPTSLAVEIAEEVSATLVSFLRESEAPRVYADEGRLGG